jgi:hypothetical protein
VEADGSVVVWVGLSVSARRSASATSGAEREECWFVDMLFAIERRCRPEEEVMEFKGARTLCVCMLLVVKIEAILAHSRDICATSNNQCLS